MLSILMVGSESPVRMQSYPAGLCKFDRLVCTYRLACMQFSTGCFIFGRLCTTLSQQCNSPTGKSLFSTSCCTIIGRLWNARPALQVPSDRLPTSRQPQHTSVVYPNVSWRVYNCRPVLTFSTGRSVLDRQCNSLPAEHIPIVRLSHLESMRFSTGCVSLGMASTSSSRFQKIS